LGSSYDASQARAGPWKRLTQADHAAPTRLARSLLANVLSVNVVMIAPGAPPEVLIQERGRSVARAAERWTASAAGFVDSGDLDNAARRPAARLDGAWRAAMREAREETGVELPPSVVRFLALTRDKEVLAPGLAGDAWLDTRPDVESFRPQHDAAEVGGFDWWPFTPDECMMRIAAAGGWESMVTHGAVALAYALAARYGPEAVTAAARTHGLAP
jgi:8-oxo-dGTP pyrophosphatase MutT (NUDIX family)